MRLPSVDLRHRIVEAPHVVILGAGASRAACPNGDANGRSLPLMRDLANAGGVRELLAEHDISEGLDDFESLYSRLAEDDSKLRLRAALETHVRDYFAAVRLPDEVTLYDRLLVSLREKDVIATFNWDPLLAQAFRRNRSFGILPRIIFLHGNVEVGVCRTHHRKGFMDQRCDDCGAQLEPVPLLYPVGRKNYTRDPFIASEWDELRAYLREAYLVTIVGYSAPSTDQEAKSLLLDAWRDNPTSELAAVEVVNTSQRSVVEATWSDFFVNQQLSGVCRTTEETWLFNNVRRSCESFFWATQQQDPWPQCQMSATADLEMLHEALQPLLREEQHGILSGKCFISAEP